MPRRYVPEGLQCSCGPDWYTVGTKYKSEYYTWFLFVFCFIVPLSLIIFSYSQLLSALRAVSPGGHWGHGGGCGREGGRGLWRAGREERQRDVGMEGWREGSCGGMEGGIVWRDGGWTEQRDGGVE